MRHPAPETLGPPGLLAWLTTPLRRACVGSSISRGRSRCTMMVLHLALCSHALSSTAPSYGPKGGRPRHLSAEAVEALATMASSPAGSRTAERWEAPLGTRQS